MTKPESGETIAGRYRLVEPLGTGGMGEVWKAEHLALKAPVAIKLLRRELVATPEAERRFEREARAAAAIRSPYVVHITDHGLHDEVPFIVMELLEGETLAARIARKGRLAPRDALRVLGHVGRALSKAHEAGVIHRDIKPANVLITRVDEEDTAKLVDFGVVKVTSDVGASTRDGTLVGTPLYMSPEQLRALPFDHRADLWSLAVVAFECIAGSPPFPQRSLADLVVAVTRDPIPLPSTVARVPAGFDAWFARATERDPDARFQSARDMMDALRPVLEDAPDLPASEEVPRAVAEAPTLTTSVLGAEQPRPRRTAAIAAALLLAASVLGVARWMHRPPAPLAVAAATVTTPAPPTSAEEAHTHARAVEPVPSATALPPPRPPVRRAAIARPSASASASPSALPAPPPPPTTPFVTVENPLGF